ncbi:sensor histidine kinase [Streptomyces sp. YIM 130001]|uniref:sensor histidine kinase n=1 Tax=Streptomyces sp. YIM 130001 TaxID=2259644 RepID=UPI000E646D0F|nr:sensor histidine kinase [Streptomyces sp. YIM 130001]
MAHPTVAGHRLSGRAADLALTLLVSAFVIAWTLIVTRYESETTSRALGGWLLIVVGCGALYFRRRRPVAVAALTLLACAAYYPVSVYDGPLMVTFAIALYTVAAEGRFVAAVILAVVALIAVALGEFTQSSDTRQIDDTSLAMLSGWLISLVAIGRAQRTRSEYLHEAEQRALAAEREQEARAEQSAGEERLRIAHELHDVLGHSISLVNVQSSAALHRIGKKPDPALALASAEEALKAVKDTSKEALRELRATLGMLRRADEPAPTAPAAGLERLAALVERTRSTGIDVSTETVGSPYPLPPSLDLAAYRIVQESLTNVARHSGAGHARVTLTYADDALRVRVDDNGRGQGTGRTDGSGVRGMAERAKAFGGELTAHNTPEGFRVSARLPLNHDVRSGEDHP